jgi:phospholipid/cholesterol/gamma-HCH transport system substrate-binding protein
METRYTNVKVGIITTIGFIVLVVLFTWKSGSIIRFNGYEVVGEFSNVGGLLETADVRYRGYNVGKVMQIVPGPRSIKVYIKIRRSIQVPKDSQFQIAFDGLIGQKFLNIKPGISTQMIAPGEVLSGEASAGIVDFIDEGAKSMQEVQRVLISIRKMLETNKLQNSIINTAANLEMLTDQLKIVGPKVNKVVSEMDILIANLNLIVANPQNQQNIQQTITNLKASTDRLNSVMSSVDDIAGNSETKQNIQQIIRNLRDITNDLNGGDASSGNISQGLQSIRKWSGLKVGVNADLLANPEHKVSSGRAGLELSFSQREKYNFGLKENIQTKAIDKYSVTGERAFNDNNYYHVGIIDSQLGAGWTYDYNERIRLITEVYQPSELKANVQVRYVLDPRWQIVTAVENIDKNGSDAYVGLGFKN